MNKLLHVSWMLCFIIGCPAVVEIEEDLRDEGEFCHPVDEPCEDDLVCRPYCYNDGSGCSVMDEPRQFICK